MAVAGTWAGGSGSGHELTCSHLWTGSPNSPQHITCPLPKWNGFKRATSPWLISGSIFSGRKENPPRNQSNSWFSRVCATGPRASSFPALCLFPHLRWGRRRRILRTSPRGLLLRSAPVLTPAAFPNPPNTTVAGQPAPHCTLTFAPRRQPSCQGNQAGGQRR